jgi:predicted metal-dependent hydrolase
MNTEPHKITVGGISVQVVRKAIKNLHLGVYPPNGRVRVAAPLPVSDEAIRLAVVGKLGWIKRQRARFEAQSRQSAREMVSGESHYYLGRRYRLRVINHSGPGRIQFPNMSTMALHIPKDATSESRNRVLETWYRGQLRELLTPLIDKWQAGLGVNLTDWSIKKMKTRWGGCNPEAQRIWINLELAKKPAQCIEYIVVHELAHLLERHHNDRFIAIMDKHLSHWRLQRQELNAAPLANEAWEY